MVKLNIDSGNRFTKFAIFNDKQIVAVYTIINKDINKEKLNEISAGIPALDYIFVSSVNNYFELFKDMSRKNKTKLITYKDISNYPIKINYTSPDTLGFDRIAAAAGAFYLYGGNPLLVIDAGTALTIDIITEKGEFCGGAISPGLQMRFLALNSFTDRLPLVKPDENGPVTGNSTLTSINAGAYRGMIFEIQGFINHYLLNYKNLKIIMTGGDTEILQLQLKTTIFAEPNLVLIGLNEILDSHICHT